MSDADLDRALTYEDSFTRPVGIWTAGIGKRVDWLNTKISLADASTRRTGYEATQITMHRARLNHPYRGQPHATRPEYR